MPKKAKPSPGRDLNPGPVPILDQIDTIFSKLKEFLYIQKPSRFRLTFTVCSALAFGSSPNYGIRAAARMEPVERKEEEIPLKFTRGPL